MQMHPKPVPCCRRVFDYVNYFTFEMLKTMTHAAGLEISRINFSDRQPLSDSMYAVLRQP